MDKPLNNSVPYDTIIRVLLKKIKIQEGLISDLEDEIHYFRTPHRFLSVLADMTKYEKMALERNPYFQKVNAQYAMLDRKYKELKRERDIMYNIINDYVSSLW